MSCRLLNRFRFKPERCTVSVFVGGACVCAVIGVVHDTVHVADWSGIFSKSMTHVVDEEVVVRKDKVQDTEHVSEDVRHEELDIDETDNSTREERNRKSEQEPDYPGQNRDRL